MMAQWDFSAKMEALVDANEQFYCGQNPNALERAAEVLRSHNLNLMLADRLLFKALEMRSRQGSLFTLHRM
jgi:hypothetical protein